MLAPRGLAIAPLDRLRVLTWHVHGSYLHYLTQTPHAFFLPVDPRRGHGYAGRAGPFPWGANVFEVDVDKIGALNLDCIVFQAKKHWLEDQYEILSEVQRRLPRIYVEHDPPREHPTDTRHWVNDDDTLLVHVTPFNALMWDSGRTPTVVIEHGVLGSPGVRYSGEIARGIVVVNDMPSRGRRLGRDVFERLRRQVPLDLVGIDSGQLGGIGEVLHDRLPAFLARYRFLLNPIRYTSLGLAVCEAMTIGLPVVGLATTEMATVIDDGVNGFLDTDPDRLVPPMRALIADLALAKRLGRAARRTALERFGIERFVEDWNRVFALVTGRAANAEQVARGEPG